MKLLAAALAMILFLPSPAAAQAQMLCGPRSEVVAYLERGYAERPVSLGLANNGAMVEVFASEAGTFTIVVTRPNGLSCLMAAGDEWQNLPERKRDFGT